MMKVTIRSYLEAMLAEKDKRDEQRFRAQAEAIATALASANRVQDQLGATSSLRAEVAEVRTLVQAQGALTDAKFVTYRALIDSQAEKVALALASSDKAVGKAEIATEKRFESVNEFRQTLSDQTSTFPSRVELQALAERVSDLSTRMDRSEGRSGGLASGWSIFLAVAGLVGVAIAVISRLG